MSASAKPADLTAETVTDEDVYEARRSGLIYHYEMAAALQDSDECVRHDARARVASSLNAAVIHNVKTTAALEAASKG